MLRIERTEFVDEDGGRTTVLDVNAEGDVAVEISADGTTRVAALKGLASRRPSGPNPANALKVG